MNNLNRLVVPTLLAISAVFAGNAFVDTPANVTDSRAAVTTNGLTPDGKYAADCDLPNDLHLKNLGGSDGAGLCVFTSISHAARWQHVEVLKDFRDYMTRFPGGGWPQKVDEYIERICRDRNTTKPNYLQVEGGDLEVLKLALKTNRMVCCTYCYSPTGRYNGQRIAHMVNLVGINDEWAMILDNNYPATFENIPTTTFPKVYAPGWSVILLDNPPSPVPHN